MQLLNRNIITSLFILFFAFSINAQKNNLDSNNPEHKIIFQLTTGDTTAHKQLIKQFNNILSVSPSTKIEVVCHGSGLDMLISDKTVVQYKIKNLSEKGVIFNACEFTMKEKKIDYSRIISQAGFVPAGIIEIVIKQEQGWNYIKAGN